MPKASKGRKRKTQRTNESVGSKKSKCDKTKKHDEEDKGTPEKSLPRKVKEEDTSSLKDVDIDEELDRTASKSNLSVFNVKSIIHHVVSDERVIAMACNAADEEELNHEVEELKKSKLTLPKVEPKLTRSRFREVAQSIGAADPLMLVKETIIHSPLKKKVSPLKIITRPSNEVNLNQSDEDDGPKMPLADIKFPEETGSSDEEYDPLKEDGGGSEEDSESYTSNTSDLASPEPLRRTSRVKRRLLPDIVSSPPPTKADKSDESATLGEQQAINSPFKVPYPITNKSAQQKEKENADLIATRTRSRLPLTDTSLESLEANFVPPDFSPDLINLEELDAEDIDWHKWLFGLTTEKAATPDTEDPEDSEYNFMAEDLNEEKEEYRNDRAVKVSQKELTELFEEFLVEFGDEIAEFEEKNSVPEAPTSKEVVVEMTPQQTECLIGQLQQHTQLLVQVFHLAREHPSLQDEVMVCHTLINDLLQQNEAASNADVCRLLDNESIPPSVFSYVGLAEAARIINLTPVACTTSAVPNTNIPSNPGPPGTLNDTPSDKGPPIPQKLTDLFMSSAVFMYAGLLPHVAFRPGRPKSRGERFLPCEDNLLVLGIAEYDSNWCQIQRNFLPAKSTKQIQIRRKNLCSSRAPDNVVKQFKRTNTIPSFPVLMKFKVLEDRQRVILPAGNTLSPVPSWLKVRSEAQAAKKKATDDSEAKKRNARKKKKASDDVSVTKQETPLVSIILNPVNVIIKPKNSTDTSKTPSCLDESSETTAVVGHNIRTEQTILETHNAQPTKENTKPESPESLNDKEMPNNSTTLDENRIDLTNDNEVNLTDIATGIPESPTMKINESSEKENLQPHKEQSCDEISASSRSETHEDAKIRDRAIAFAQSYLNNVKKRLKNDSPTYQSFLKVLLTSKSENWSPTKLYKEVSDVLSSSPELVRDFVGFLEPHQALEAGVFMTNNKIFRARAFLKRVETHFQKNPSHFQKIIKAFTQYNFKEPKPADLYDTVVPLLKGQQYLTEEFNTFFNHLQPPPSNSEDFEEVELESGSEIEFDDFEEVTIPDVIHGRNARKGAAGKGKCSTKTAVKLSGNRKQLYSNEAARKGSRMKKRDTGNKNNGDNFRDLGRTRECDLDGDREVGVASEGVNRISKDIEETGGLIESGDSNYEKKIPDSDEEEGSTCRKIKEDVNNDGSERCDAESAMSPVRKYGSEQSNESSPASESVNAEDFLENNMESPATTHGSHMTSTSEGTSDLSNEACDVHPTSNTSIMPADQYHCEELKGNFVEEKTGVEVENVKLEISKEEEEIRSRKLTDNKGGRESYRNKRTSLFKEKTTGELINKESDVCREGEDKESEFERISANNLELDQNGKSVIVWTREDDKKILQVYQSRGSSENIYNAIAQELGNKTADQVEGRFHILVKLLAASNNADSSSEESGSEADDESCDDLDDKE